MDPRQPASQSCPRLGHVFNNSWAAIKFFQHGSNVYVYLLNIYLFSISIGPICTRVSSFGGQHGEYHRQNITKCCSLLKLFTHVLPIKASQESVNLAETCVEQTSKHPNKIRNNHKHNKYVNVEFNASICRAALEKIIMSR